MPDADARYVTTLAYTESLVNDAVFEFWRRTVGTGFFVAVTLLGGSLAALVWLGDRSWVAGAMGAFLVFALASAAAVYVVHRRNTLGTFRKMGAPVASLEIAQDSFTLRSELGSTTLPWTSVKEVWRFRLFWLLLFSKSQFVTVPVATMPDEAQAFMLARVTAAGGKVTGQGPAPSPGPSSSCRS